MKAMKGYVVAALSHSVHYLHADNRSSNHISLKTCRSFRKKANHADDLRDGLGGGGLGSRSASALASTCFYNREESGEKKVSTGY